MGATYTRQSSYTDGDVITAAHTNDEFNQLLAAFVASTGHTHNGDAGEGGPITKLLGTAITIGNGAAGTDIAVTFDGETNDGLLTWMEDEDLFKFADDIMIVDNETLIFGTDSDITVSYDEATTDSLKIAAKEGAGLAITLMADEGDDAGDEWKLNIADGGTLTFGNDINSAGTYVTHLTLTPNATVANSTLAVAGNLTVGGSFTLGSGAVLSEAELEMLDGITAGTAAAEKALVVDSNKDIGTIRNLTIDGTFSDGNYTFDTSGNVSGLGTVSAGAITTSGVLGITDTTDASDATGDTGALRTKGGASIAKKLYVGTDLDVDGTANLDVVDIDGAVDMSTTLAVGGVLTANAGVVVDNITIDGTEIDLSSGDLTLDVAGDIILNTDDGIVSLQDDSATFGSLENSSGNLIIKSGTTTALTFSGANVTLAGDLTISGDDLTMGTNTSGHIMVADGTNFNPVAVSGDVTIASNGAVTIASGAVETAMVNANVITGQTAETSLDTTNDTILIHDNSASALRKVTLASLSSGLGGITDVVADTSPQLGADLDTNSFNILIDDAHFIGDENGNEQIIFQTTASAINQFEITNSATSTSFTQGPNLAVTGGDTHIDLNLTAKGEGHVVIKGNTNPGAIRFNCESNSHGQTLIGAAHSANATNTLVLPTDAGTLVGTGDTGTVTNGMLAGSITAAKLAGSIGDSKLSTISTAGKVALSALEIDGASDIGADLADDDLIIVDDGAGGTEVKSELTRVKKYIYSAMSGDATASDAGALTIGANAVEGSMLNTNAISGQTELASGLADTDELMVSDAGTLKRMDMSVVKTYLTNAGFSSDDPTALAIALG